MIKRKFKVSHLVLYFIIACAVIIQIYPIFWLIMSSFKTTDDLAMLPQYALPSGLFFGNYTQALSTSNIPRYFLNSTIVAVLTLAGIVLLSCPVAFAISKFRMKHGKLLMSFFLLGMMIPVFACLIPMFQIYNLLGLRNTYLALIIPQIGFSMPICIYLYTGYMSFLPNSLLEAAIIDGASTGKVFRSIIIPMSKNTTVTVLTFNFVFVWNEFTYANTFMSSSEMKTLPVGLNDFAGQYGQVDWGSTFAAITLAILPTLIIYFILNKNIMVGMTAGAVKS